MWAVDVGSRLPAMQMGTLRPCLFSDQGQAPTHLWLWVLSPWPPLLLNHPHSPAILLGGRPIDEERAQRAEVTLPKDTQLKSRSASRSACCVTAQVTLRWLLPRLEVGAWLPRRLCPYLPGISRPPHPPEVAETLSAQAPACSRRREGRCFRGRTGSLLRTRPALLGPPIPVCDSGHRAA